MKEAVAYRPPQPEELADCTLIWHAAVDDYMRRLAHPLPPPYLAPLLELLGHVRATDPERFLVAVRTRPRVAPWQTTRPAPRHAPVNPPPPSERVVGFGIAVQREHVWFLSQLYVLPEEQGRGVGRALLTRILPSVDAAEDDTRPGVLATCTDSAQPVSNGLYGRFGIVPRMPVFNLVGRPTDRSSLPALPEGIAAVPFGNAEGPIAGEQARSSAFASASTTTAIEAIDRAVLGYAHGADHAYLRASGRTGFVYRTSGGEAVGYGYSSAAGRFGPVALLDETLTAPVLAHLLTAIEPRGATSAWVPGANDRAMVAMLRAGLKIEGFPALLCWTRPFAEFERYMPAGLSLL